MVNELTQWRMESDTETDSFLKSLFNREVDIDTNKGKASLSTVFVHSK